MIRYFGSHPTAANVLMFAILALGLAALPKLQRDTFPLIPPTEVQVRIVYPGASTAEVENEICLRMEDALDSVAELEEVRCDAREGLALTTAQMVEGGNMDAFFNDVQSQVESITTFPDKVERPSVTKLERTAVVASIAITGVADPMALRAYAERVRDRLKQDGRIAQVTLLGFSDPEYAIEIPDRSLRRYGLTVGDVAEALARQVPDVPGGTLVGQEREWIVRLSGSPVSALDLGDQVVVSSRTGGRVRLGDIATVTTRFDRPEQQILFNGRRAALLEVSKTQHQDSLRVMDAINEHLRHEQAIAPPGITLALSQDVTSNIRDRLRILVENGIQGLVLVFLVMWLFFNLRFSFWVSMGLPVSFLGAVFFMYALGYTLNMMTMVGLLVAIGLLMDDAIVISENVAARMGKGDSALDAAIRGTREVLPGVVSSFLTTAVIVGPLAFLSGRMGAVLKYLPAVLLITLAVSLVEAFLILPAHLRHSLAREESSRRSRVHAWFDARFDHFRERVFGRAVDWVVRRPYLTLGLMVMLLLVSLALVPAGWLKYRAFPELESDVIQARVILPQGTPLARTEAVVGRIVDGLRQVDKEFSPLQPGGHKLVHNQTVLYGTNVDAFESGPHVATVSADLLRAEERKGSVEAILARWRALVGNLPDVIALRFTDQERGVAGKAIELRIQGEHLPVLKQASLELQRWLRGFRGVRDVSDDLRPGKPELLVHLKPSAGTFGITARSVADELRAALHGRTGLELRPHGDAHAVTVRLADEAHDDVNDLRYLEVRAADGRHVPLDTVASIEEARGYARIQRVNGQRTVTVQGEVQPGLANAREVVGATVKRFLPQLREKYPGLRFSTLGQAKETAATGSSLAGNLLLGLVGVYLLLVFQLRSYVQPWAVLLAIPMGWIGVAWGHFAMGFDLTMPSLVGFATLAGVVVNDNILLVGFIKDRLAAGMPVAEAARLAVRDRFRPIILTSLTTIAGLLPLLTETSTQAQFLIPLVASIAFGLLTATLASLLVVPAFFVILHAWQRPQATSTA